MKYRIIIDKKTGNEKRVGLEQSEECHQLIEGARAVGNVVSQKNIDHDDDAPVHDGVNVQGS